MMMKMTSEPADGLKRRPPPPNVVRWETGVDGKVRKLWHPGFLTKTPWVYLIIKAL